MIIPFPNLSAQNIKPDKALLNEIATQSDYSGFIKFKPGKNISAATIFKEYKTAFGLKKNEEMQATRVDSDRLGMLHHRYSQRYNGIPVEGGEYIVHERNGRTVMANGRIIRGIEVNTNPAISSQQAFDIALNNLPSDKYLWESEAEEKMLKRITKDPDATYYPKVVLCIAGPDFYPELKRNHLAYKLNVGSAEPIFYYDIYIDAMTGRELFRLSRIHEENEPGIAVTMYSDTVNIMADHFPGGFRLREVRNGVDIITYDANNGRNMDNATDFVDTDNFWNNVNRRLDQTATDVHWGAEMTYDYYRIIHNRNSIDGKGMGLISLVHVGTNWYNATWNGSYMSYGDGNNSPLTDMVIVSHEFTHGVTQNTAGLIYKNESGALNESFSDIFGVSAKTWAGGTNPDGSAMWRIVGRNMANPNQTGQPDTYQGRFWSASGAVHVNSQVQNHWFYLLVEGGSGTNDNEDEYEVESIGIEKAEQIAYRNLAYYLTPSSNYSNARNGSLQAAEDLYGICSNEYKQVAKAWHAVGVGYPVSADDFGVVAINSPDSSCLGISSTDFFIEIKYYGACSNIPAGTEIPISFSINAQDTITKTYIIKESLQSGESTEIRLDRLEELPTGLYSLHCWTQFPGDLNTTNDLKVKSIYNGLGGLGTYSYGDLSIYDVASPISSCDSLSPEEQIEIEIMYNSCIPGTAGQIPVYYRLNGGEIISESVSPGTNLRYKESIWYTFNSTIDLSQQGIYNLEIWIDDDSDPDRSNDTIAFEFAVGKLGEFPYFEDFEAGPAMWESFAISDQNDWQWGKPNQANIDGAASGENAWMTNLNANYSDQSEMVLQSPCFDFTELADPFICFDSHFRIEVDFDGFILEYSLDDSNWERVELPGYNSNLAQTVQMGTPWFSGYNGGWRNYCAYMPELAGESFVRFRFRFGTDAHENEEGIAIDNFSVKALSQFDISVSSLAAPADDCSLSDAEDISISLVNVGSDSILTLNLSYSINGSPAVSEQLTDTLLYGAAYSFTFAQTADLSEPGEEYDITITAELNGDADLSNNTITQTITNIKLWSIPFAEDFEEKQLPGGWKTTQTSNSTGWFFSNAEELREQDTEGVWPVPDHTSFAVVNDVIANRNRRNDFLITPHMDFTTNTNVVMEFDVYFNSPKGASALVKVSTDKGQSWNTAHTIAPYPEWHRIRADLSDYDGQSCILVAFHYNDKNQSTNGIAIDNVSFSERPGIDAGPTALYLPEGACFSDDEKVIMRINNFGTEPVSNFYAGYIYQHSSNSPVTVRESVNEVIQPGESMDYIFSGGADLSDLNEYSFSGFTSVSNDDSRFNDTIKLITFDNTGAISEFPHIENFDSFIKGNPGVLQNGWTNDGRDDIDWRVHNYSTPTTYTGPSRDHTQGSGMYMYVESSQPNFNKTANLYSPCFDLRALSIPYLRFWYSMYSGNPAEGDAMGTLSVDVYDGQWHENVWSMSGNQGNQWNLGEVNLSRFGNDIKIRFRALTGPAQFSDIAIDDVEVYQETAGMDVGITSLPGNGCGMTTGTDITIGIRNYGTAAVGSGLKAGYILDGGEKVEETVGRAIASEAELLFTFAAPAELSSGNHYFDFYVSLGGDMVSSNDSVLNHRVISYTKVFNYETMTECEGITAIVRANNIRGYESFAWHHDSTAGTTMYTDSAGIYTVSFTFGNGCVLTDSVEVIILPAPMSAMNDTTVVKPFEADAGIFESYLWQDNSTERTFFIDEDGSYYVTVSDSLGCYGTDSFEVNFVPTGVDQDSRSGYVRLYPNPAPRYVNVEIANPGGGDITLTLTDIHGRKYFDKLKLNQSEILEKIDLGDISAGVYFLQVRGAGMLKVHKIVVE